MRFEPRPPARYRNCPQTLSVSTARRKLEYLALLQHQADSFRLEASRVSTFGPTDHRREVGALDAEGIENGDGVPNTRRQRIARLARLVASALTAMIGEDQAELVA
jgi:hypothetical protein